MYNKNNEWTVEELKYLTQNYLSQSNQEIADVLTRTSKAVQVKLSKLGLKRPEKYCYDHTFFEKIDTEEKAYWLGFLYADGYVTQGTRNAEVGIELSARDIEHLKKFNKSLKGNITPTIRQRKAGKINSTDGIASFRLYNKKMVEDLIKLGCVENKTFVIKMPDIQDKFLIWHFIRGYFDGDGSIYLDKSHGFIGFNFASGSDLMLKQLREFLYKEGIYAYFSVEDRKDSRFETEHKSYKLLITGMNNAYSFGMKLYENSNIYLTRKRLRFDNYVKQFDIDSRCKNRPYRRGMKFEQ